MRLINLQIIGSRIITIIYIFFSACSQKLTAWQETTEIGLEKLKLSRSNRKEVRKPKASKNKSENKNESKSIPNLENITVNPVKTRRRSR